jgi:ubiquitin carboxyl-terminal hydrolase 5/13
LASVSSAGIDSATAKRARLEAAAADGKVSTVDDDGLPIVPRLRVSLGAALLNWASESVVDDYVSPATNARGTALRRTRLLSLPPYLCIVLGRYELSADWTQKKIDADVDMPYTLSFPGALVSPSGGGLQPGEAPLPEDTSAAAAAAPPPSAPVPDEDLVARLVSMGFPDGACRRAALASTNDETATEWLLAHMDDADFSADYKPAPAAASASASAAPAPVSEESLALLIDMGFARDLSQRALRACGNDLERSTEWLFSHDSTMEDAAPASEAPRGPVLDSLEVPASSDARYEISAIISHMGSSTGTGHYVAHVRKDPQGRPLGAAPDAGSLEWTLFNDAKVARSKNPPLEAGYVYVYRRM